jgi:hypothetical protein
MEMQLNECIHVVEYTCLLSSSHVLLFAYQILNPCKWIQMKVSGCKGKQWALKECKGMHVNA